MADKDIKFRELPIPASSGKVKKVYYVVENGRSQVMEGFKALDEDQKDSVKALIIKMAINGDFKSPKIKNHLSGYSYGEIRPKSHRFFFFYVYGENIIFFYYKPKKMNSLGDKVYRSIDKKREKYEEEFKKIFSRN